MKAKNFKYQNVVFAKNQPEYQNLPALKLQNREGEVVFCMGLSLLERLRVLFLGEIWVSLMMFGQPLTPSHLTTKRKEVFSTPRDRMAKIDKFNLFLDLGLIIYYD